MYSLNVTITCRWILTHLLIMNMDFNEFRGSKMFSGGKFLLDESSLVVSHTVDVLDKLVAAG